jgi:hypothetical protein
MTRTKDSSCRMFAVLVGLAVVGAAGCGSRTGTQSVDSVLQSSGKARETVYPLAGKITVDNQTPEAGGFGQRRILVLLFDQSKLEASANGVPKAICNANGDFAFNMYDQGDGVPPGKYVLAIVELKFDKRKGYFGEDVLKNQYNDPTKNANSPEFKIDHQAPGKKDYAFDLKVADREKVSPGPKAVTTIRN